MTKALKNKKNKISIKSILNSPISIIIVLIMLVIGLLIYTRYLVNATNLYTFSGFMEDISILNGSIYTSYDINAFTDSKIIYSGKDKKIYDFKIGYYIKKGDDCIELVEMKGREDLQDGASLKEVIEKSDLSFTETHKKAQYLSKENLKNIKKMYFIVSGKDSKNESFSIEVPLEVKKMSK